MTDTYSYNPVGNVAVDANSTHGDRISASAPNVDISANDDDSTPETELEAEPEAPATLDEHIAAYAATRHADIPHALDALDAALQTYRSKAKNTAVALAEQLAAEDDHTVRFILDALPTADTASAKEYELITRTARTLHR